MQATMRESGHSGWSGSGSGFPDAPEGWTPDVAKRLCEQEGLELRAEHLEIIRALQSYFARHDTPGFSARELCDALEEHFHRRGGLKYLYELFPGGPVAQGCRIAGLAPPPGSQDAGFGSVM